MPSRYGAGEIYGYDFNLLTPERICELSRASHKSVVCPFRPKEPGKAEPKCNKKGGVCSLRQLSNCEIVWFVVCFRPGDFGSITLERQEVHFTTLSHAVEGLTGGVPMSLERFEVENRARLQPL